MGISSLVGSADESLEAPNIQLSLKAFVFCLLEEVPYDIIHKDGKVVNPERSVIREP